MRERLLEALTEAQRRGFLGPGSVDDQLAHAESLTGLVPEPPARFLDLGSGAGLPGLVVATAFPDSSGVLLDAHERRCAWLQEVLEALRYNDRVQVVCARAETAAHDPTLRAAFDLVTARSFARPAVTAECAAGFLASPAHLVVSEPPAPDPTRWPPAPLASLGLELLRITASPTGHATAAILTHPTATSPRYPRRPGIPEKRPLW